MRVKEDRKLSLDAFAHDTQYSRSSWNRVLKCEGFPPREAIERLCARRKLDQAHFLQLWETADAARRAHPAPAAQPQHDEPAGAEEPRQATGSALDTGREQTVDVTGPEQGSPAAESAAVDQPADAALSEAPEPASAPRAVPDVPPAATSVPPAPSTPVERERTTAPAPALVPAPAAPAPTAAEEVAVVRPLNPTPHAGKKRRVSAKLLVLAGLVVVLVLGRWAALPDHKETAGPPTAADDRPTDTQPPADAGQAPNDDKPDGGQPTTPSSDGSTGTGAAERDTPSSAKVPAPGETPPGTSPSAGGPSPGEQTPPGESPSAEAPATTATPTSPRTSAAPTTTAASVPLGAEGRENCNYNSDRTQTMAKGMVGSKVRQIQCFLKYNYDSALEIDGNFGSGTEAAVKAVQQCSGIKADGQVGPQTWKYL
ncbi:peptidoglycan-binding protein, partial [Streptomyces sp. NPDC058583]